MLYNAMQRGEHTQMHSLLAYSMNCSLINGCDTHENNIHSHSFFWRL